MNDPDDRPDRADELRQRAEARVREGAVRTPKDLEALSPTQTWRLLHDLQVHQIELEMQNEELRRTQLELDAARERYFGLYDLAPVGYCTVSESGLTLEANLTAARLLGVARRAMVAQPFSRFILGEDHDVYYLHRKQLFATGEPQAWQVRMVTGGRHAVLGSSGGHRRAGHRRRARLPPRGERHHRAQTGGGEDQGAAGRAPALAGRHAGSRGPRAGAQARGERALPQQG